jgi:hypothetical protein
VYFSVYFPLFSGGRPLDLRQSRRMGSRSFSLARFRRCPLCDGSRRLSCKLVSNIVVVELCAAGPQLNAFQVGLGPHGFVAADLRTPPSWPPTGRASARFDCCSTCAACHGEEEVHRLKNQRSGPSRPVRSPEFPGCVADGWLCLASRRSLTAPKFIEATLASCRSPGMRSKRPACRGCREIGYRHGDALVVEPGIESPVRPLMAK